MVFKKSFLFSKKRMPTIVLLAIVLVVTFIINHNYPLNYSSAHSSLATPTEIFSLWNDTSPTLDGSIHFNSSSLATEWSAAAVYSMFDYDENFDSKILLQNNNTNLYIGLDLVNFQTETPVTIWGAAVYIDRDQNGIFNLNHEAVNNNSYMYSKKGFEDEKVKKCVTHHYALILICTRFTILIMH